MPATAIRLTYSEAITTTILPVEIARKLLNEYRTQNWMQRAAELSGDTATATKRGDVTFGMWKMLDGLGLANEAARYGLLGQQDADIVHEARQQLANQPANFAEAFAQSAQAAGCGCYRSDCLCGL